MAETSVLETITARRAVRPVLIASHRNVTEHATVLRNLLVGLADESVPVGLVCPTQCDTACVASMPLHIFSHPMIDIPILDRFGVEPLAVQLEKFRPTVLHCLCESRVAFTERLAARLNVPYILSVNSLVHRLGGLPICPRRCVRIMAAAPMIAAQIARSRPDVADRIMQINLGAFARVDMACFANPSRMPSVVVACSLNHVGHLTRLFDAVRILLGEGREFVTVVMGGGREEGKLRKHLIARGLSQSVTVVPILNSWRSVLAAADIFVRPEPSQQFSVFLLEAMAHGAAVAACAGGVDNLIGPGRTAVVFDPASEPGIRRTIAQLLDNHAFAREIARAGQEQVRADYAVSAMVSAVLGTYAIVQRRRGH